MEIIIGPGRIAAETTQARIDPAVAIRALDRVRKMQAADALGLLMRAGTGMCEPVARLLQGAIVAADELGAPAHTCIVLGGEVGDGEPVTRVRRKAHGLATWITTETIRIRVELQVLVLRLVQDGNGQREAAR